MKFCKLLLTVASAGVLFGAFASPAFAARLRLSSTTIRAQFREVNFTSEVGELNCRITLEGSFHESTMAKVAGTLIGYITRARLGICVIGNTTILTETLPWHVRYSSFTGTLPSITTVVHNIIGFTLRYRDLFGFGFICRVRSTATEPLITTYRLSAGAIAGARLSGTINTTPEECNGSRFPFRSDEGAVSVLNTTTRVSVTLI